MSDKPLAEWTLEELWELFPIVLRNHNLAYREWYEQERDALTALLGDRIRRISHIGSTAVPGLLAKPTVDILMEVSDRSGEDLAAILEGQGWLLMSGVPTGQPLRLVFNKGYTPQGFADKVYHLHVRPLGDWDELYFRDYLLDHPETAAAYAELKRSLLERYEHDRDGYTQAKTPLITTITDRARVEYPNRYVP
ncbi:MAG: GrpB family protein [Propionibacteriaceae bacterium]|jgi:GrpB-like predicted nucleotidyltransferase (UPF0157 family)|nr:GrpB family protein [Propionibacteriaceae bacterium]